MNFIADCDHFYTVIDEHNGCFVCTNCGLVQDEFYCKNKFEIFPENDIIISKKIQDILHYFKIECTSIGHDLTIEMQKLSSLKHNNEHLAALLYFLLLENNNYIRLSEVCLACNADEKKVWSILKDKQLKIVDIKHPLEKICSTLGLNYQDFKLLLDKIEGQCQTGHNPLTIIGSYIFHLFGNKISIETIAQICNINVMAIKRYIKKYQNTM